MHHLEGWGRAPSEDTARDLLASLTISLDVSTAKLVTITPTVRALLADSHALFRDSLRALLEVSGVEVCAAAATAAEATGAALRHGPDIAIVDLHLEPVGGPETVRLLRAQLPDLPILVLATGRLDQEVAQALRNGAWGYLFKGEDPDAVLRAIAAFARGNLFLSPELARFLLRELRFDGSLEQRGDTLLTQDESSALSELAARSGREPMVAPLAGPIFAKLHRRYAKSDV
jgi:DNA-binding NarL/FixJ family response regulator